MRAAVVELAARAPIDETISFDRFAQIADLSADDREGVRFAVNAAKPILLRDYKRALVSVRGEGYRVALPREHAGLAERDKSSSDRKLRQAIAKLEYVDLEGMTQLQRAAHERTREAILLVAHAQAQANARLDRLEKAVYGDR